jgi:exodeoxyribonuclease V
LSIVLSAEQERARSAVLSWYRDPHRSKPWFYLAGYGGTGKSTVITAITESIPGKVLYAAPTGRAALVMIQKGCIGAQTLHSLLYKPKGMSGDQEQGTKLRQLRDLPYEDPKAVSIRAWLTEAFNAELAVLAAKLGVAKEDDKKPLLNRRDILKKALGSNFKDVKDLVSANPLFDVNPDSALKDASLLVVDEISMVPRAVVEDILRFNVPVLVQGDVGQLPPIKAQSYFADITPDFNLQEIHRQAKDSPIIYLATLARQGKPLPLGAHGNCLVTREPNAGLAMEADQIIVGMHKTRHATNDKVRSLLGYQGPMPNVGEKVICRKNNNKLGLANGDQFEVTSFSDFDANCLGPHCKNKLHSRCLIGIKNQDIWTTVKAWKDFFLKQEPNPWAQKDAESLDYSYSITCHSAQGGAWPSVYVKDESRVFKSSAKNWLYTSISRASQKVVIVVP